MNRREGSPVLARRATRIRPGLIVSTIVDVDRAQTITVERDSSAPLGVRLLVEYAAPVDARSSHQRAVAIARNPTWTRITGTHLHFSRGGGVPVVERGGSDMSLAEAERLLDRIMRGLS